LRQTKTDEEDACGENPYGGKTRTTLVWRSDKPAHGSRGAIDTARVSIVRHLTCQCD
jgi:hypothetical protein